MYVFATLLRIFSFLGEWLLAIPLIGKTAISFTNNWLVYGMLLLHIISFLFSKKARLNSKGNVLGFIACIITPIPYFGTVIHFVAAFFLLFNIFSVPRQKKKIRRVVYKNESYR